MGEITVEHEEAISEQQQHAAVNDTADDHAVNTYWNHIRTLLLFMAVSSIYVAQLLLFVGGGAFARDMATVIGGASLALWPTSILGILALALSPPVAQAADYWGRKKFLVVLTSFGCVGCIIVSRATSMEMAIAGWTVGGLSFGVQPLLHAVVSEVLPRKHRSWAQAGVNIASCVGALIALLVGGALVRGSREGFRTYYYMSAGIYALSTLSVALLYNPPLRDTQIGSTRSKLQRLDWVGYFLMVTGLVLFCVGLAWAQNPYPWKEAHVLGPFLVGIFLLVVFGVYEWKFKKDGLFHHDLFKDRNFTIGLCSIAIEGMAVFGTNAFLPFELGILYPTWGAFRVSLCYSISFMTFFAMSFVAGFWIWKTRSIRIPSMLGFLGFLLFFILLATAKASTPGANFWVYTVFSGIGLGFTLVSLVTAAQLSTPPQLIAIASGLMLSMRSIGGTVSLAIYNAVFSHALAANLGPKIASAALPLGLPQTSLGLLIGALTSGNTDALASIPGVSPDIIAAAGLALQDAYRLSFTYVWATAGALMFVGLVVAGFFRDPKTEFSAKIDAPLDVVEVRERAAEEKAV